MKLKDLLESQKDNNNIIKYEDKYYALAIENDSYTNKILNVEAFEIPKNDERFETFIGIVDFINDIKYIVNNTKTSEYVYFDGWENPSINLDTDVEPLDLKYITLEQYKVLQQAHTTTRDLTVAEYIKNNITKVKDIPKYNKHIDDSITSHPIHGYTTNAAKYVHKAYDYLKNNNINPIKSTDYIEEYENHLLEHYIETKSNIDLEAFNNVKTNNNKVTYYKNATTLDIDDYNPFSIEESWGSTVVWYGYYDEEYMKISEFYDTIKDLKNTSNIDEIYLIVQEKHLTKKFIDIYEDIVEAQNVATEIYNIATTEFDIVKTYLETALHTKEDVEKALDYIYQDKNSTEITRI